MKVPAWVFKLKRGDLVYCVERPYDRAKQRTGPWRVRGYVVRRGIDPTLVNSQVRIDGHGSHWPSNVARFFGPSKREALRGYLRLQRSNLRGAEYGLRHARKNVARALRLLEVLR